MTLIETTLAITVLLITPGPTNTLLALAGAERGVLAALRLIPAELAGYLLTVVPLTLLGAGLLMAFPAARPVITLGAATWVMWLAVTMWRLSKPSLTDQPVVTQARVFVTTLLNPKALIFGLVLLPAETGVWLNIGNFAVQVVVIASLWARLGAAVSQTAPQGQKGLPSWLRRIGALWLAFVSVGLVARVLGT